MDEVLVDILGFTVPLAVRLEGVRGHFFVANALFYRDADVCLNYVDPKHQFRFGANLLAQPDGLHVQVSRRRRRPEALEQGSLDGLCGIYSIVNSILWALRTYPPPRHRKRASKRLPSDAELGDLFIVLLSKLVQARAPPVRRTRRDRAAASPPPPVATRAPQTAATWAIC